MVRRSALIRTLLTGLVVVAALALPTIASAANTFVNQATGSDANNCTSTGSPCLTIGAAITKAGTNDTIQVADPAAQTTYAETLTLGNGKTLDAASADPSETIIDNGAAVSPAISVPSTGAGTISGFTIRSGFQPVRLDANATVTGNRFDQTSPPSNLASISIISGSPTVQGNTFSDTQTGEQWAISQVNAGSAQISGNTITGFNRAISVGSTSGGSTPTISDNVISGIHDNGSTGFGIVVDNGAIATITGNQITSPLPGDTTVAIVVAEGVNPGNTGATLRRNRVLAHSTGVSIVDTAASVTLDSDLIAGQSSLGLGVFDTGAAGGGDVTATNLTADLDGAFDDITVSDASLTLDSSFIDSGINVSGTGACAISFSRGPTTSGTSCQQFQTTAAPMFVNPAAFNYHLQAGSPLIDAGNPTAPPDGTRDFEGDARVLDGDGVCPDRRDIGADERVLLPATMCPPETAIDSGPSGTIADSTPTFGFSTNEPDATFQCRVDGDAFGTCGGPGDFHTAGPLVDGAHSFEVRATDSTALTDPSPATRSFTVDTSVPQPPGDEPQPPTDDVPPAADTDPPETSAKKPKVKGDDVTLKFSSDETGSSFRCRLDRKKLKPCTSPKTHRNLDPGKHKFRVVATDRAGNRDPSAAKRKFEIE